MGDTACGLSYLHGKNPPIIHRDLTPNNILLGDDFKAKISDFGIAKKISNDGSQVTMTNAPGTADFMPPECFQDVPKYDLSLDAFSFGGVVLYTITEQWPTPTSSWVKTDPETGKTVYFSGLQRHQKYLDMMTNDVVVLKRLVESCLNDNPKEHPEIAKISATIKEAKDGCDGIVLTKGRAEHEKQFQQQQRQQNKMQLQVCH